MLDVMNCLYCPSPKQPPTKLPIGWAIQRLIDLARQHRIVNRDFKKYWAIKGSKEILGDMSSDASSYLKEWKNWNQYKSLMEIATEKKNKAFNNYIDLLKLKNKQLYRTAKAPKLIKNKIAETEKQLSSMQSAASKFDTIENRAATDLKKTAHLKIREYSKEKFKIQDEIAQLETYQKDLYRMPESAHKDYLRGTGYTSLREVEDEKFYLMEDLIKIEKSIDDLEDSSMAVTRAVPDAEKLVLYNGKARDLQNELRNLKRECPTETNCNIPYLYEQIDLNKKIIKALEDDLNDVKPIHETIYYNAIEDEALKAVNRRYLSYKEFMEPGHLDKLYKNMESIIKERDSILQQYPTLKKEDFDWV